MDAIEAIERIYRCIEKGEVDNAVRGCLRVSRYMNDYFNSALFLWDLFEDKKDVARAIMDDAESLGKEGQQHLYNESHKKWLVTRTLPFSLGSLDSGEEKNILIMSVGEFQSDLEQCERQIMDLKIPSSMGEFDSAAFMDRYSRIKYQLRLRIKAIGMIKSKILNHCFSYANQIENQLDAQQKSINFLAWVQNEVQNYFKIRSEDIFDKLQKANQLIDSSDKEDLSILLTHVRRIIKSVADYFYPPLSDAVMCSDGVKRILDDDRYLNRLQEFLQAKFKRSSSTELLRAEFDYLLVFAKKLNHIASKGVHGEVSMVEAKQGFLGLYLFLFNICQHLEESHELNEHCT